MAPLCSSWDRHTCTQPAGAQLQGEVRSAGSPQALWWVHGPPGEVSGCRPCITESRWGHSHPAEGALQEGLYNDEAPGQDQRMRTSHMEAEGG